MQTRNHCADDRAYFTTRELAARWRKSSGAIHQMRWRGDAPVAVVIGGRLLFDVAVVEAFEQARQSINTSSEVGS